VNQQDLEQFLSHLAVDGRVSSTTQRVAFNALLFLFRHVLAKEISGLDGAVRARIPKRLPVVLSRQEILRVFDQMEGTARLMAGMLPPIKNGPTLAIEMDPPRSCMFLSLGGDKTGLETLLC